jgi:hypothetical protein
MFLPFTIVTVRLVASLLAIELHSTRMLSVVDAEGTKSHEEFSLKVREHMSTSLEVPCVNVIAKDIKQWKEGTLSNKINILISNNIHTCVVGVFILGASFQGLSY